MSSPNPLRKTDRFCGLRWPWHQANKSQPRYQICDRLHEERIVNVAGSEIAGTISSWLDDLGVQSPWVEQLAKAVQTGDWTSVRIICDHLSVNVSYAA